MFDNKTKQLSDLKTAYKDFVEAVQGLNTDGFTKSLGDWTPRDIVAHLVGWNRITLVGCGMLREGVEPFYFYDGTNDYRKVNAKFFVQFPSTDKKQLVQEIEITKYALIAYLKTIPEAEWELDTGIVHYRGDAATVARCVDSLIRDYHKHRQEILKLSTSKEIS